MMPSNDALARELDWLPLKRYLELYAETNTAVLKRIKSGHWKVEEQYSRPKGAGIWVSIKGINAWASRHVPDKHVGAPKDEQ